MKIQDNYYTLEMHILKPAADGITHYPGICKFVRFILCSFFILQILIVISCGEVPSPADIEQINDRHSPEITLEYPADGDTYDTIIQIKGKVIDEQEADNQNERIIDFTFTVNDQDPAIIPIDDNGSFYMSFSTYYLEDTITITLTAKDFSGNVGIKKLFMIDGTEPTPFPSIMPTPPIPTFPPGKVWFDPDEITTSPESHYNTKIYVNSGSQSLAAYSIRIYYNPFILNPDFAASYNGVEPGAEGFISAVNSTSIGTIIVTGFNSNEIKSTKLHLLTVYWIAENTGVTSVDLNVDALHDNTGQPIGVPLGDECHITVELTF